MKIKALVKLAGDLVENIYSQRQLTYITETANWSTMWDGIYITRGLNKQKLLTARTSSLPIGLKRGIVHFGSFRTIYFRDHLYKVNKNCRTVLTIFHMPPHNPQYKVVLKLQEKIDVIHTSSMATKVDLLRLGVREAKITVVPLGVDTSTFQPRTSGERQRLRQQYKIPVDVFVIGSFQKDGQGWGKGNIPKLEKGPDIFVQAVKELVKQIPVHVLLVGPARGYVQTQLKNNGIPYTYVGYIDDYLMLPSLYKMIDVYIISSRVEGGPKALLESWASGIPVVSTKMGMVADIASHGENALISEVEDVEGLVANMRKIGEDIELREKIVKNALVKVKDFDWTVISRQYYDRIYRKLI